MSLTFRKRAKRALVEPSFTVQLHRIVRDGEWPDCSDWRIGNSWEPIKVRSLSEARSQAHELRQSNRWGAANASPHVTITDEDGNAVPEWEEAHR